MSTGTAALPATVPGAEPPLRPPANRVSARAVQWWRLRSSLLVVVLLVPQMVVAIAVGTPAAYWLAATALLTALVGGAYVVLVPRLLYRIHRWEITDEAVYTLSGWLVREWRIAPISRVQTVDTQHGPLQQLLKLASVTAPAPWSKGPVAIRGLAEDHAAELARLLTATTQATPGDAT